MTTNKIEKIVAEVLEGASKMYLEQIVDHGIHNVSNEFHGETDEEYEAFSAEFDRQAKELLESAE